MPDSQRTSARRRWPSAVQIVAGAAVLMVVWAFASSSAVVHAHPAYPLLLGLTLVAALLVGGRSLLGRRGGPASPRSRARRVGRVLAIVAAVGWLGVLAWLRPFGATDAASYAMTSSGTVTVAESATSIVFAPTGETAPTAVFFQPGARVDARAYAVTLRPLAESGFLVVVPKQPLGIAFLATSAFESARDAYPEIEQWAVAGHSLGGTVASMDADEHDADPTAPVVGLVLYASYPAADLSGSLSVSVLSVSGTRDGLATPESITASRRNLPAETHFVAINGAVHSYFGDYGLQPGDGTPTISHDEAREQIVSLTRRFLADIEP